MVNYAFQQYQILMYKIKHILFSIILLFKFQIVMMEDASNNIDMHNLHIIDLSY